MSINNPIPSVFESFNARNLTPRQVARSFIPPESFNDLCLRSHSLIIGPRGSGKTTLLKMLQLPALAEWSHPDADKYRKSIDFTGVFIPTDISWGAQLNSLGTNTLPENVKESLGFAAFTTHVLISFIDAIRDSLNLNVEKIPTLGHHAVSIDKQTEVDLVKSISEYWQLSPSLNTFDSLKLSLRGRLSKISEFANKEANSSPEIVNEQLRNQPGFHLDFIDALVLAIEAVGLATDNEDKKWALLFDELEIAPRRIRMELFKCLRSTDQRILFKLSISPYSEDLELLDTSVSAMPMQDYKTIDLWYPRKESSYAFCEALLKSMLDEAACPPATPEEVFGYSEFESEDTYTTGNPYGPGGKVNNRFLVLSKRDSGFRSYLDKYDIKISEMHLLTDVTRASTLRKVTSIVAIREAYRGDEVGNGSVSANVRSRKNPDVYTGAKSLFAIVEGNPRWFIGMVTPLIREYKTNGGPVDKAIQATCILSATNKFRSLLRTIPYQMSNGQSPKKGLLSLLDEIGSAFHQKVVKDIFTPEPPLSFVVDSQSDQGLIDALGKALNAGAVIYVPDEGSGAVLSSLKGKRFRLSYMLAPHYKIPLVLGSPRSLRNLLSDKPAPSLFDENEF
jgi:hypothetical protein